jgi:hypothetical protein
LEGTEGDSIPHELDRDSHATKSGIGSRKKIGDWEGNFHAFGLGFRTVTALPRPVARSATRLPIKLPKGSDGSSLLAIAVGKTLICV